MIELISLAFIIILFLILYLLTKRSSGGGNGSETINLVYGSDLYFNRSEYPAYVNQAKLRIMLPMWSEILGDYDYKAVQSIALWETGYFSAPESFNFVVNNNNILGIEDRGKARYFSNVNNCLIYFDNLMHATRYESAYAVRHNGPAFIEELRKAGYNSKISWQEGVLGIYNRW